MWSPTSLRSRGPWLLSGHLFPEQKPDFCRLGVSSPCRGLTCNVAQVQRESLWRHLLFFAHQHSLVQLVPTSPLDSSCPFKSIVYVCLFCVVFFFSQKVLNACKPPCDFTLFSPLSNNVLCCGQRSVMSAVSCFTASWLSSEATVFLAHLDFIFVHEKLECFTNSLISLARGSVKQQQLSFLRLKRAF